MRRDLDEEKHEVERYGVMPGRRDPDAERATRKEREAMERGMDHGKDAPEDNSTPPAGVDTGYVGLGPDTEEE